MIGNTTKVLSSLEYYDQVVANAAAQQQGNTSNITRREGNLQIVPIPEGYHDEIAICNLAVLLPFRDGTEYLSSIFEYAGALALAAQHLNTGDSSVVSDLGGLPNRCNIRFTVEWLDTSLVQNHAVDEVIRATDRPDAPCAFLGAMRSAVSMPTSIITGLRGYPQISAFSTSADLDNAQQYPLFGRTIPADSGIAVPIVLHLRSLGVRYLGVVYVNDPYGTAFARGLQAAAQIHAPEMTVKSIDIAATADSKESIQRAVKFLKDTEYNYLFGILFPLENFKMIMTEAYEQGIAGTGKHTWLFSDAAFGDIALRTFPEGSALHKALVGTGVIMASGGLPERMPVLKNYLDELEELRNLKDLDYLISRSPYPEKHTSEGILDDEFLTNPSLYSPFLYDSVISVGLAACNAAVNTHGEDYFDGHAHFDAITRTTFVGPSGPVRLDTTSGSRDPSSAYSALANFVLDTAHDAGGANKNGTVKFKGVISGLFDHGEWLELKPFVYADGSNIAPPDLDAPDLEQNFLGMGWRLTGWVMCSLGIALALTFALWTHIKRETRVFKGSQPFFLHIICCGIALFMASIFPLGVDEEIASEDGCTVACTSFLWLISVGFSVFYSALYTKTRRVNKIFNNPRSFERIKVTPLDVAKPMIASLGANFLILILMTILSPLEWTVEIISEDQFGRPTETRGYCDWSGSLPYVAPLASINFACILFSVTEAHRARHISIEFAESEWIFMCTLAICLAFFFAFPILLLVHENNAAFYFFLSATIFTTGCVVLMLIFVPKIRFHRKQVKEKAKEKKDKHVRVSMSSMGHSSSHLALHLGSSSGANNSGGFNLSGSSSSPSSGLLVLSHPKTEDMLRTRIERLEQQLRELAMKTTTTTTSQYLDTVGSPSAGPSSRCPDVVASAAVGCGEPVEQPLLESPTAGSSSRMILDIDDGDSRNPPEPPSVDAL